MSTSYAISMRRKKTSDNNLFVLCEMRDASFMIQPGLLYRENLDGYRFSAMIEHFLVTIPLPG